MSARMVKWAMVWEVRVPAGRGYLRTRPEAGNIAHVDNPTGRDPLSRMMHERI